MCPYLFMIFGINGLWMSYFIPYPLFVTRDLIFWEAKDCLYPSLTGYSNNYIINIIIMFLIIAGGIGFFTWDDIYTHKFHIKRYRMQSKTILTTTALLIILPAVLFFLCNFKELPFGKRLILSLFQSVTPRTAGFNTADISSMTDSSQAVMILLMFIGGSPKLYCRRYKDNHLCGSVIKCFCNFPQPRRCLCLWTPL